MPQAGGCRLSQHQQPCREEEEQRKGVGRSGEQLGARMAVESMM